jgi:hypothetical protein
MLKQYPPAFPSSQATSSSEVQPGRWKTRLPAVPPPGDFLIGSAAQKLSIPPGDFLDGSTAWAMENPSARSPTSGRLPHRKCSPEALHPTRRLPRRKYSLEGGHSAQSTRRVFHPPRRLPRRKCSLGDRKPVCPQSHLRATSSSEVQPRSSPSHQAIY